MITFENPLQKYNKNRDSADDADFYDQSQIGDIRDHSLESARENAITCSSKSAR